jgi:hypothetical protein
MTPDAVVNNALDLAKLPRIGSLYDGTPQAVVALDLYTETVDEVLISSLWPFARSETTLVGTGLTPIAPWSFEFLYPAGAIRLWFVKPAVIPSDPAPIRWLESGDPRLTGNARSILTTFAPAVGIFTQRISDPNLWPPNYTLMVIEILAKKMQMPQKKGEVDDTRGRDQQRS